MGLPANATLGCSGLGCCAAAGCCCLGCLGCVAAAPALGFGMTLVLSDGFSAFSCLNEFAGDTLGEAVVLGDVLPPPLSVDGAARGAGTALPLSDPPAFSLKGLGATICSEGLPVPLSPSFFSSFAVFFSVAFFSSPSLDSEDLGESAGEEPPAESEPEGSGSGAFADTESNFSGLDPLLDSVSIEVDGIGDLGLPLFAALWDLGLPMSCDPRLFAFLPPEVTACTAAAAASCCLAAAAAASAAAFLRRSYAPWSAARLV
mmetsp:Transcript_15002/g.40958  ORF Transcript_15002/g.40958 Transcript_15002/m.40958 type:complete len:260 (-) Transcript_15002:4138-4917(-)